MRVKRSSTPLIGLPNFLLLCAFSLTNFAQLQAAELPDAGRLLREQPKTLPVLPSNPQLPITPEIKEPETKNNSATVLVKSFRIDGAKLIPVSELQSQISFAVGKELSLSQLRSVAELLVVYYSRKGYLAQASLPPQEIDDGIVLIKITEGKRGSLMINNQSKRVKSERVQGFIDYRLAQGDAMSLDKLGESVNLLNEQPGTMVKASLKSGAEVGDTDLLVTATDKPLATFNYGLSNKGSRGTGEAQAIASVSLNNPLGLFDLANLLLVKSEGSTFGLGEYGLAVGNSGLRAGVNFSRLNYDVTQNSLRALDAHGSATTFGLKAQYPLYRLSSFSLDLIGNLDTKHFRDDTIVGETSDRRVNTATLGIGGSRQDGFGGGGVTGFGLSWVHGHTNEDNQAAVAADKASRNALGSYDKLVYNLDRQQRLSQDWILTAKLSGQVAFDNIESSGRFFLGGADYLRAYPTGEAGADEGWLLSLNLIHPFTSKLQGSVFIDTGTVRVNKDNRAGLNAGQDNRYKLTGAGVAIDWKILENLALNATLAAPIGNNSGRDANGNDSDGRNESLRAWVSLVGQF